MFAEKTIVKVSRSERRAAREMAIWKNDVDRTFAINRARQEERAETSLEIARKMKAMCDSTEKIQAITGLPIETITAL